MNYRGTHNITVNADGQIVVTITFDSNIPMNSIRIVHGRKIAKEIADAVYAAQGTQRNQDE
jgi:hypothetical protein